MIKFDFVMEDIKGSLERLDNGQYRLTAEDGEDNKSPVMKIITEAQAASLLFCSFDPDPETDPWEEAQAVQEDFPVQLIP